MSRVFGHWIDKPMSYSSKVLERGRSSGLSAGCSTLINFGASHEMEQISATERDMVCCGLPFWVMPLGYLRAALFRQYDLSTSLLLIGGQGCVFKGWAPYTKVYIQIASCCVSLLDVIFATTRQHHLSKMKRGIKDCMQKHLQLTILPGFMLAEIDVLAHSRCPRNAAEPFLMMQRWSYSRAANVKIRQLHDVNHCLQLQPELALSWDLCHSTSFRHRRLSPDQPH